MAEVCKNQQFMRPSRIMAHATMAPRDEKIVEARLGAYHIARRTKTFPRQFWAVMTMDGKVLIEMSDGRGEFNVFWAKVSELGEAARRGDVVFEAEL